MHASALSGISRQCCVCVAEKFNMQRLRSAGSIMPVNLRSAIVAEPAPGETPLAAAGGGGGGGGGGGARLRTRARTAFEERVIDYEGFRSIMKDEIPATKVLLHPPPLAARAAGPTNPAGCTAAEGRCAGRGRGRRVHPQALQCIRRRCKRVPSLPAHSHDSPAAPERTAPCAAAGFGG